MKQEQVRIAHVIGKLNAAGVEAVVNNYYRNIDHSKYQFDYIIDADSSFEPPQELIDMGARYYVVPPYQNLLVHMKALIRLFKKNEYKIVHSGMNTLAVFSLCAAWIAGVPVRINHNHSTASKGETKRNILKYILRPFAKLFATDYVACSYYAGEWMFGKKSMQCGEVTVFNNAIDLSRFKYDETIREKKRLELEINDKFVIGHVGRFCFQKNQEFLIEIFEEVHKQREDTVLMLIGIGETVDQIKDLVKKKDLQDYVLFLGARSDVNELYQAMDVFVLPSRYEGLPVVGVEAQASGLPCVFSTSMTDETKMTGVAQMISLDKDITFWAQQVLECANMVRKDTCEEIKKAGFEIETEAKKLERFYKERLSNI